MARFRIKFCVCAGNGADLYLIRLNCRCNWFAIPSGVATSLRDDWLINHLCLVSVVDVRCIYLTASKLLTNKTLFTKPTTKSRCFGWRVLNGDDCGACGFALYIRTAFWRLALCGAEWGFVYRCDHALFARVGHGCTADFNHFIWE